LAASEPKTSRGYQKQPAADPFADLQVGVQVRTLTVVVAVPNSVVVSLIAVSASFEHAVPATSDNPAAAAFTQLPFFRPDEGIRLEEQTKQATAVEEVHGGVVSLEILL